MDKKESPKLKKEKTDSLSAPAKIPGISAKAFGVIKFILGILLLPFVYSFTIAFLDEFALIDQSAQNCFWSGAVSLLLVYLFIWEPAIIYAKGQKLLEILFTFFRPLVRVAPYLLPIYTLLLFALYGIIFLFDKSQSLLNTFIFLTGFSMALHLVFSAKTLRSKQGDFLKGNYIFGFSFVYIINLLVFSFCVNLIFAKFSFVNFSNNSFQIAKGIFSAIFNQLFVP